MNTCINVWKFGWEVEIDICSTCSLRLKSSLLWGFLQHPVNDLQQHKITFSRFSLQAQNQAEDHWCWAALPVWRCWWLPSSSRHGDPEMSSDPGVKQQKSRITHTDKVRYCGTNQIVRRVKRISYTLCKTL